MAKVVQLDERRKRREDAVKKALKLASHPEDAVGDDGPIKPKTITTLFSTIDELKLQIRNAKLTLLDNGAHRHVKPQNAVLEFETIGSGGYGSRFIVTDAMLEEDPELLRDIRRALNRPDAQRYAKEGVYTEPRHRRPDRVPLCPSDAKLLFGEHSEEAKLGAMVPAEMIGFSSSDE